MAKNKKFQSKEIFKTGKISKQGNFLNREIFETGNFQLFGIQPFYELSEYLKPSLICKSIKIFQIIKFET
jgi:hypothetical protein